MVQVRICLVCFISEIDVGLLYCNRSVLYCHSRDAYGLSDCSVVYMHVNWRHVNQQQYPLLILHQSGSKKNKK